MGRIGHDNSLRLSNRVAGCRTFGGKVKSSNCSDVMRLHVAIEIGFIGDSGPARGVGKRRFSTDHRCGSGRRLDTIRSRLMGRVVGRVMRRVFGTAITG